MIEQHIRACAGVLLIDADGNIIAQHRDDKPDIGSPGKASFFGGLIEPEDTSPRQAAARELAEETNLGIAEGQLAPWLEYQYILPEGVPERAHIFILKGVSTKGLEVYEGQGYHIVTSLDDPMIADVMRPAAEKWFANRSF